MVDLEQKALQIRQATLDLIYKQGAGHIGSDLSCTDILVALYYAVMNIDAANPEASERDRYIQSKGHAAEVYWTILADKGFFPKAELDTFSQYGSRLIGHPNNKVAGVEMNTGSLGHGLAIATGIALGAKMDGKSYHTYVLMGDGELAEGSVWEAAMAAPHYQLHNLTAIIDRNGLQISGASEQVMAVEPLVDKWQAFGWHVIEVDGNNMNELVRVLRQEPVPVKPTMVIANTIKGKGIHAAENNPAWHHYVPNEGEYLAATKDLQTGGERNE